MKEPKNKLWSEEGKNEGSAYVQSASLGFSWKKSTSLVGSLVMEVDTLVTNACRIL